MSQTTSTPMTHLPDLDQPTFLLIDCACSAEPQLGARDLDDAQQLCWVCASCGALATTQDPEQLRWVDPSELERFGFFVEGFEPEQKHGEGGCRGGRCGVQQSP